MIVINFCIFFTTFTLLQFSHINMRKCIYFKFEALRMGALNSLLTFLHDSPVYIHQQCRHKPLSRLHYLPYLHILHYKNCFNTAIFLPIYIAKVSAVIYTFSPCVLTLFIVLDPVPHTSISSSSSALPT